jgi:hypothetical protein
VAKFSGPSADTEHSTLHKPLQVGFSCKLPPRVCFFTTLGNAGCVYGVTILHFVRKRCLSASEVSAVHSEGVFTGQELPKTGCVGHGLGG